MNDAPVIVNPIDKTINEDESTTVKLFVTDPESDPITFTVSNDTMAVAMTLNADELDLEPVANWNGESLITVTASDGSLSDF